VGIYLLYGGPILRALYLLYRGPYGFEYIMSRNEIPGVHLKLGYTLRDKLVSVGPQTPVGHRPMAYYAYW
jgi:hypothetical protein